MKQKRAILLVLDSLGIGNAPDAEKYGDKGANTLGNIAKYCLNERKTPLDIPNLAKLGMCKAYESNNGSKLANVKEQETIACYGFANEVSQGKDTPSGHWEIAGVPVPFDWEYYEDKENCFPQDLLDEIFAKNNLKGSLANRHASGTEVIETFGQEHIETGLPIFYTSVDSVFQIACDEKTFGLENLYNLCKSVRKILDERNLNVGRVIARPFIQDENGNFVRTGNRDDYAVLPPKDTLLDKVYNKGNQVHAIGKISSIYAHKGVSYKYKASGHEDICNKTLEAMKVAENGSFIMSNFVDFDMVYGHRRDVKGYANAIEEFDSKYLPKILENLQEGDLLCITADHGCDPTYEGISHTREAVPVIFFHKAMQNSVNFGKMDSFSSIAQTFADYLELESFETGVSVLSKLGLK